MFTFLVFLDYTSGYLKFCWFFCIFEMAYSRAFREVIFNHFLDIFCKYYYNVYKNFSDFNLLKKNCQYQAEEINFCIMDIFKYFANIQKPKTLDKKNTFWLNLWYLERVVQYTNRLFQAKRYSTPNERDPSREIHLCIKLPASDAWLHISSYSVNAVSKS